jgi:hypothetical protein
MSDDAQSLLEQGDLERAVSDYLGSHADFFERHPGLLEQLRVPHEAGESVSLVERQLGLLRRQVGHLRAQLQRLIDVARENEALHERLHRLTLALIDAGSFETVVDTLRRQLSDAFQADAVALKVVAGEQLQRPADPADIDGARLLRDLLATGEPRCGALSDAELAYVFDGDACGSRSVALIPILGRDLAGALAIGSRDAERFHAGNATDFLTRLGEVVTKTVQAVCATPRPAERPTGVAR